MNKRNKTILGSVFAAIFILGLIQLTQITVAQDDKTINISQAITLEENSLISETQKNISSIDIDLSDSRFNITNLELNFSNIIQHRKLSTIEDNPLTEERIYYKNPAQYNLGIASQFELKKPTNIFGVYVYGEFIDGTSESINIQINGFDETTHTPNETVHLTKVLEMNTTEGWHFQNFSSQAKVLNPGNYSVFLNGSGLVDPASIYYWYANDLTSKYPNLYSSLYDGSGWYNTFKGRSFLFKILQRENKTYFPSEINMNVEINGTEHLVNDGNDLGYGSIDLNENFHPGVSNLHIPVNNNDSAVLNFTVDISLSLKNNFRCIGDLEISNKTGNEWSFNFNTNRIKGNYSLIFAFPSTWENFSLIRNSITLNPGSDYLIDTNNDLILIHNNSISYGLINWQLEANSIVQQIDLNIQKPNYQAGEEISIGVSSPSNGNYTYVLYALDIEKYSGQLNYPEETNIIFSYNLSSNAVNGYWTAYIYWNNQTDAGVATQIFSISGGSSTILLNGDDDDNGGGDSDIEGIIVDPLIIFLIFLISGIVAGASYTSYVMVQRYRAKKEAYRKRLHDKVNDILNLNYIMITDRKSGLNVYEQFLAGKDLNPTLISGFLDAIRAFGIELTGSYQNSQTVKLEYKESKIIMSEYKNFRIILILTDNPSESFLESVEELSYDIDKEFGKELENFKGDVRMFAGIKDIIEKHFYTTFIHPLTIVVSADTKLTLAEQTMVNKAKAIMKKNNLNYFFTTFLMADEKFNPKNVELIFKLIDKKIFRPVKLD
ncbi:MAG: hypothetical protein GF383_11510 [Candidatus Lokiarchaeota archaeon]|nr:hypothetical protein [Candidatus Lokiarchaeota archaeon]MBD3341351.1 hypothetical protein [Candidatus Lokiarchaeota archaeon]